MERKSDMGVRYFAPAGMRAGCKHGTTPLLALLPQQPPRPAAQGPTPSPNILSPRLLPALLRLEDFRAAIVAGTDAQKETQLVILGKWKVSGNLPWSAVVFFCKLAACKFRLPYFPKLLHDPDCLIVRFFPFSTQTNAWRAWLVLLLGVLPQQS